MMKRVGLALVALALAACGPRQTDAPEQSAQVTPTLGADFSIGPDGAAGLGAALAMDATTIAAATPRFAVAEADAQVDGEAFKAITLSAGGEEVFRILPNADRSHIHAIVTRSAQARGPMQEIVGRTLFGVAPPDEVDFCIAQSTAGAPGFACSTDEAGSFWRVYRLPAAYDGPADAFGEIEPDVLHDATLVEMRWIAPRAP